MGLECPFDDRQEMLRPDYEFFHSQGSRPLDIAYHSHDFYEVFLFVSGRAEYIIEGKTYALRPGDILLTNDRELHRPLVEPGRLYERYVLWIRPEYIRKLQEDGTDLAACFVDAARREYKRIRPGGELIARLMRLCGRLEEVYGGSAYGCRVLERAYVMELLVYLNRAYFETAEELVPDVVENQKINAVVEYQSAFGCGFVTGRLGWKVLCQQVPFKPAVQAVYWGADSPVYHQEAADDRAGYAAKGTACAQCVSRERV